MGMTRGHFVKFSPNYIKLTTLAINDYVKKKKFSGD